VPSFELGVTSQKIELSSRRESLILLSENGNKRKKSQQGGEFGPGSENLSFEI
jgi:hypothetical protein